MLMASSSLLLFSFIFLFVISIVMEWERSWVYTYIYIYRYRYTCIYIYIGGREEDRSGEGGSWGINSKFIFLKTSLMMVLNNELLPYSHFGH